MRLPLTEKYSYTIGGMTPEMLKKHIGSLDYSPDNRQVRFLAILSAVIAVGRGDLTSAALEFLEISGINRKPIYETILQSYLFLGFPRMIDAAIGFRDVFGDQSNDTDIAKISAEESKKWYAEGKELCRRVYGKNYDRLKERFMAMSPDLFRWMVLEGYGKVLSRPGMTHIERELAEVAALIVDRRERQLVSHVMGSLNVGAQVELIRIVNEDIRPLAGEDAFREAAVIIEKIEKEYAAGS